ncbi:MAG: hypothetical protein EAZ20_07470 [Bacteroidetes bacterium]|nr:MAG: hypothetical protein EAZ20_07470 [Bacteroidota bacterium]
MKITLDIQQTLLIEQLEIVFERFYIPCATDILEKQTVTEAKRQARVNFFNNYKPVGNKGNYMPTKGEWYEQ